MGIQAFAAFMDKERPEFSPGYFNVVRAGWLHIGVGSAVNPKILIRVQGPTTGPADDELLEAKELMDLGNLRCLRGRRCLPCVSSTAPGSSAESSSTSLQPDRSS